MSTEDSPDLQAFDAVNRIQVAARSLLLVADDCDAVGLERLAERISDKANRIISDAESARRCMSLGLKNRTDESRAMVGETLALLLRKPSTTNSEDIT